MVYLRISVPDKINKYMEVLVASGSCFLLCSVRNNLFTYSLIYLFVI